jgi:ABC-2 type transport system permease protein
LLGAPTVLLTGIALRVGFEWSAVLRSTPYVLLAAVLLFLWTFLLALTAFWTDRVHAVVGFGSQLVFLFGGTAAPIALLPDTWRRVAEVLPFYGMNGLPADIATGGHATLVYQLIWAVVLAAVVTVVWRIGVRRYTAVGS